MNVKVISAILVLALAGMACGFDVNLPQRATPGAEVTEAITVAVPGSEETRLTLLFGAGTLKLSPGAKNLVEGVARYNYTDLKPNIIQEGERIEIKQGNLDNIIVLDDIKNEWDLKLGSAPMDLIIQAGAYEAEMELGGLSLRSLTVRDGAAKVEVSFSEPNRIEMSVLRYETGASNVTLSGLANANFSTLMFSGGAGDYTLDFSGELQRDATVTIEAGLGDVNLVLPRDMNVRVTVESAAVDINHGSGWTQSGNVYSQKGEGPTLTVVVKMAAGSLSLTD
ncbi:MAG TPA: toast rack family protein [Anaerolineales bacterium]|nr:toast rack family protein [Anaerolineales bacterium]